MITMSDEEQKGLTGFFSRFGSAKKQTVSEEEIKDIVADNDELADDEKRMIHDVIDLGDMSVHEIMQPRVDMIMVEDTETVRTAVLKSLQQRKWTVASTSFPITAKIENRGQLAFVSIIYADGMLKFDTKGSKIGDNAYVPIRYVDFLMKTINKNIVLSTR